MTPAPPRPLLDLHPCDLCHRYRRGQPRFFGTGWVDSYWACRSCRAAYLLELTGAGGVRA